MIFSLPDLIRTKKLNYRVTRVAPLDSHTRQLFIYSIEHCLLYLPITC